jgi:hypothetical protein
MQYAPLKQDDMPPGPAASLCNVAMHLELARITMKAHGRPDSQQFVLDAPYFFTIRFAKREVMASA